MMDVLPSVSPTGKRVVPYEGPLDAEIVVVAESPAEVEMQQGRPLVGRAGKMWDAILNAASISRSSVRIVNAVPVRAPGDKFSRHTWEDREWGKTLMQQELRRAVDAGARVIMPMGNNPLAWIAPTLPAPPTYSDDETKQTATAEKSRIGAWRGSVFQYGNDMQSVEDYYHAISGKGVVWVLPTYHPAAVARQFSWNPLSIRDFQKARALVAGTHEFPVEREWFVNRYDLLSDFIDKLIRDEHVVSIDTESSPYKIVALVGASEVHTFAWEPWCAGPMERLLKSSRVVKVAHNAAHDWTFFWKMGIKIELPHFDTGGGHHIIHGGALQKNLSPAIASWWTAYPYHKWLVDHDPKIYCGLDTCVAADAYKPQREQLKLRGLDEVSEHDHRLLYDLLEMQWSGVLINEELREEAAVTLGRDYKRYRKEFQTLARSVVESKLRRFDKPHLFQTFPQCTCCRGAKKCATCAGLNMTPKKKADYVGMTTSKNSGMLLKADLGDYTVGELKELMPVCRTCSGKKKVMRWKEINPESPDQLKDILYKGLRISPRKFDGKTTTRASQLAPLLDKDWLNGEQRAAVEAVLAFSKAGADLTTMLRLQPDDDGMLHCVFDPWGTVSGRVASKEGLLQVGTNLQNIPVKHRYIIVPEFGFYFVAPDYSQIETRNVAVVSQDQQMLDAFVIPVDWPGNERHGTIDTHTVLQQHAHGMDIMLHREQCKIWVYGGMYGGQGSQLSKEMTSKAFATDKGIAVSVQQGNMLVQMLLKKIWPGLSRWHTSTRDALRSSRQLVSPTGRVRKWNMYVLDRQGRLIQKILNEGLSYFPQDMGAWVLALGLKNIKDNMPLELARPKIHVHDELVIQIPRGPGRLVDEALEGIQRSMIVNQWGMEYPIEAPVPLENWKEAKDG